MSGKNVTNADILNSLRNEMSLEYQDKVPVAASLNGDEVLRALSSYPSLMNEFITTLTNRVVKTKFFNKIFNNPLKMLHKGELPYGKSLEQLFVEMAEVKGWGEHFTGSNSEEGDLIKAVKPKVKPSYITQNYAYKFKTSISQQQLKGAFMSNSGLQSLVKSILDSLYSSVYYQEYTDMKKILMNPTEDSSNGSTIGKGLAARIYEDEQLKDSAICYVGNGSDKYVKLLKGLKKYASKMSFPSSNYNLNKVKTFSNKEDLVIFITPDAKVEVDVDVLSGVFNLSKAETSIRTIEVDDLGTVNGEPVLAILADSDVIQAYDTINESNTFYNPDKLTTNIFMHRHGIMAQCDFSQSVVFVEGTN